MNDSQPTQSLCKLTAGVFAALGLCAVIALAGKKVAERIQQKEFASWSYTATNEIPLLLRQNSIADAYRKLENVKGGIADYKADKLQAGFHINPQELQTLEARLNWNTLTNNYLTNVSPEAMLQSIYRKK